VLTTDLEYGACDMAWERVCARAGARYVRAPIPFPVDSPERIVDALFAHAGERTRAVYVSHVTSGTALVLPVAAIVERARAAGWTTIVDGAHGPAQVPVDLDALGADIYAGNCHKWLMSPKGAGFLYVAPDWWDRLDGPIVSWGYEPGKDWRQRIEEQGTRDPAAFLAVPDAIRYQAERDWDAVRERCRALTREARRDLCALLGTEPLAPEEMLAQMATVRLPKPAPELTETLFQKHRVEIPVSGPDGDHLRISIAAYTTRQEVDRLLAALAD